MPERSNNPSRPHLDEIRNPKPQSKDHVVFVVFVVGVTSTKIIANNQLATTCNNSTVVDPRGG